MDRSSWTCGDAICAGNWMKNPDDKFTLPWAICGQTTCVRPRRNPGYRIILATTVTSFRHWFHQRPTDKELQFGGFVFHLLWNNNSCSKFWTRISLRIHDKCTMVMRLRFGSKTAEGDTMLPASIQTETNVYLVNDTQWWIHTKKLNSKYWVFYWRINANNFPKNTDVFIRWSAVGRSSSGDIRAESQRGGF